MRCVLQSQLKYAVINGVCIISRAPLHLQQWLRLMNWSGILRPRWRQTEGLWGLRHVYQALNTLNSLGNLSAALSDLKHQPINDTGLTALTSKFIFLFMEPAAASQTFALMLTSQNYIIRRKLLLSFNLRSTSLFFLVQVWGFSLACLKKDNKRWIPKKKLKWIRCIQLNFFRQFEKSSYAFMS